MHPSEFAASLKEAPLDGTRNDFDSLDHKLEWISVTCQEICTVSNIASLVTNKLFNIAYEHRMDEVMRRIEEKGHGTEIS